MIKGLRIGTIDGLKLRFTGEEVRGLLEERSRTSDEAAR